MKPNELESAVWRPYHLWNYGEEENIVALAVSLLAGIIHNHPFIDGNKRTALVAARGLLLRNGYDLSLADDALGPLVKGFAAGQVEDAEVQRSFERHLILI